MISERITVNGISYIRENTNSLRILDNATGGIFCSICGKIVPVSEAIARDVQRTNIIDNSSYHISGHGFCVGLYQRR